MAVTLIGNNGNGGGKPPSDPPGPKEADLELRRFALHMAVEWARSRGPEQCTHIPPGEFVEAATAFYEFMKGKP